VRTYERFKFKLGAIECIAIKDDNEVYPLSDLTRDTPEKHLVKALRDHGFPSKMWSNDFNCLLIKTDEHQVLIDVGWGCGTQRRNGRLIQQLQVEGIAPEDIDLIVFTHWDSDHVGGIINVEGKSIFPNAHCIMWRVGWDYWSTLNDTEMPEEYVAFRRRVLQLLEKRVELVETETEFLPGFHFIAAAGHRPDHVALAITSFGEQLLHLGDAILHPILMVYPEWRWPDHSSPEQAARDQKSLLELAVTRNALVFGAHLPFPGLGYVMQQGERWSWLPVIT
jgi:glyoxylase-like metal-dependent hydrolase (beta-lactamase superfamily II)